MTVWRFDFLKLLLSLYMGADVLHESVHNALARFPGRENLPWSLGSALGAAVARFLPCRVAGVPGAAVMQHVDVPVAQMELSPDGTLLYMHRILMQCQNKGSKLVMDDIAVYACATGAWLAHTSVLCGGFAVAADGTVFIAQLSPQGLLVMSPKLVRLSFLALDLIHEPRCIAVSSDRVYIAMHYAVSDLVVVDRGTGSVRSTFPRALRELEQRFQTRQLRVTDDALVASGQFIRYVHAGGWNDYVEYSAGVIILALDFALLHVVWLHDCSPVTKTLSLAFHAPSNDAFIVCRPDLIFAVSIHNGTSRQLSASPSTALVAATSRDVVILDTSAPLAVIRELH